ncbi:helix-turn-helix domain-containing protein [Pseudoduganella namucuonensis]|uniref:helix-turn-helix domain-containing protein n=1 Tax=Pseudoduganella namucuonensis TaxID=1035707 RepID=UPI000B80749F|nr:helix-turn-helix domain-containing protein [Pseudoduganella namucuonensis]
MATNFPIRFAAQLRQHIKALRKARGLTQAQLGEMIGVSQARIAEIEANPGLVRFEQLMQLLSTLGVTIVLNEDLSTSHAPTIAGSAGRGVPKSPAATGYVPATKSAPVLEAPRALNPSSDVQPTARRNFIVRPKKGTW